MRRDRPRLERLAAVLVIVLPILIGIPIAIVVAFIPTSSFRAYKLTWILSTTAAVIVVAAVAWWQSGRSSGQEQAAEAEQPDPDPVVVGEIPRRPVAFVARATVDRLADAADSGEVAVLCAVTGMRGVGKTHVAAAYARRCEAAGWGLVGWVNAETRDALLTGLARIAGALGVADPEGDSEESSRRLRQHLETRTGKSLVVFDNATDPDALRHFLPAVGSTQIVVTSTDQAFASMGVPVDVSWFTRPESTGYLAERTGLADEAGADEVATRLGDLPLALAQAAATIKGRHWTYLRYLAEFARIPVETLLGRDRGGDYPRPTAAALLLSVQAAEDSDPSGLTGQVLRVMAALSPDGVPRHLLHGLEAGPADDGGAIDAAVQRCAEGSLLTWSAGDSLIMHRLLGRVVRDRDVAAGRWTGTVAAALGLLDAITVPEDQVWSRRNEGTELATQVEALWDADAAAGSADLELAEKLLRARGLVARQLKEATDLSRAIEVGTRALTDSERVLGQDHHYTLDLRVILAGVYESAGRLREAIPLYERNVADSERILGPDQLETLTPRDALAHAYMSAGLLDEAIPLYERNVADSERILGPDDPDTLTFRNNLASAYVSDGRPDEAIELFKQNIADGERILATDDLASLTFRSNLAQAYVEAGRLDEAIGLQEQNVADCVRTRGPGDPKTLASQINLAWTYWAAERRREAIELFEQVFTARKRLLGPDHPDTLSSQSDLAHAYQEEGYADEMIEVFEQMLTDSIRVLGPDHPRTLASRVNLADAYQRAGPLGAEFPVYEQALADNERVLGPDHPDTLSVRAQLASVYQVVRAYGEAIRLYEQNVAHAARVFGPDDTRTFSSQASLARAYERAGQPDEAIPLYEQLVADTERVLGPDNHQTLAARDMLARAHRRPGKPSQSA